MGREGAGPGGGQAVVESRAVPCRTALAVPVVVGLLLGCRGPARTGEPLGELPDVVTSAEPLWIPYRVMAGQAYEADPREGRLRELRRVTFDGKSSHPRWDPDSRQLLFERGAPGCGELVKMDLGSGETVRLSPEGGASSLGGYLDDPRRLAFVHGTSGHGTSVHGIGAAASSAPSGACRPSFASGAPRWAPPAADVWVKGPHAEPARALLPSPAAEMELATNLRGQLVFTSLRDGDPELYLARADGTDLRRLTRAAGYDGGASLSPDGTRLVWQTERAEAQASQKAPNEDKAASEDKAANEDEAASEGDDGRPVLSPSRLHLRLAGVQGQHERPIGPLGRFDVEASFLPDSRRLLFSSDYDAPPEAPPSFEIYLVDPEGPTTVDGKPSYERITYHAAYDGQAVVSPDGRWIAFASTRAAVDDGPGPKGQTDIFVARWREVD